MTKRNTQFPTNIPTGPLKTNQKVTEPETNPLAAFFRKSKLSLTLPSRGLWYPANTLMLDTNGGLAIYSMNASDDIKFRTGDATMSGKNIYEVIRSCAPGILRPELIPHIDVDSILLAIRIASYGADFDFVVNVPNTTLTRSVQIHATELLSDIATRTDSWDSEINIEDETGQALSLVLYPITLSNLFSTSKNIYLQRRVLTKNIDADENIKDEDAFETSVNSITVSAIDLLCSSIRVLKILTPDGTVALSLDANNPQDILQIKNTIHQLDIEYFNSIRDHIDTQRKKYLFITPVQTSDEKELAAGAPPDWTAELSFMGSNFLPDQKAVIGIA